MTKEEINKLFEDFRGKHILLLGDVMLDAYVWGNVNRMSPEAPVPVLDVSKREERLGGLANVALNLRELGAKVSVCSVIGNDAVGEKITHIMESMQMDPDNLVKSPDRISTIKTRVISENKHVIRIDEEQTNDISRVEEFQVIERVTMLLENTKVDAVLFEDYNKGNLTENLIHEIVELCNEKNILTCVDPKKKNFLSYKNVSLFKPNLKEIREGLSIKIEPSVQTDLDNAHKVLTEKLNHGSSLITLSEYGVYFANGNESAVHKAHQRSIVDVSGAGDTVIAVATLALCSGCSLSDVAFLSNLAGGLVCEQVGVVPINRDQFMHEAVRLLA